MCAGHRRLGVHERHAVLELIAESVRAARLIDGGTRPHAAGERLVERPAVHQRVELVRRRVDANGAEARRPCVDGRLRFGVGMLRRTAAGDDVSGCLLTTRGTQQEDGVARLARLQADGAPQCRAGIDPGAGVPGELVERESGRRSEVSVAPDERGAISGRAGDLLADPGEGNLLREILAEEVLRENGARLLVAARMHLIARRLASGTEYPLDVARHDDPTPRRAFIAETQTRDFHRIFARNAKRELCRDPGSSMFERRDAWRMDDTVRCRTGGIVLRRPRARRRTPDVARLGVLQVDHFTGRVTHRVVVPGSEPEEVAVLDPGEPAAPLSDTEAGVAVRDHIRPCLLY